MKTDKIYVSKLSPRYKNMHNLSIENIYTLFEAEYLPDFYFDGECHAFWEMVYVISGQVGITADNKVYTLSAGDVVFHKPMEFHKIWIDADAESSHVFTCAFDLNGILAQRLQNGIYHLWDEPKQIFQSLLAMLRKNFPTETKQPWYYVQLLKDNEPVMQLALHYLETAFLHLTYSGKCIKTATPNEKMQLYTQIASLLEEHIYDKITISQIARKCNVSTATAKNCFAEYAGCGIHKYFLNIKIRAAIDLLRKGKTVSEVSELLQFANPNYFSYVFKRETGTCASSYKGM